MEISESVRWIFDPALKWGFFRSRPYRAAVQTADPQRIYNVPDSPGVVYNYLEDAYEQVSPGGYVITGILGEMWPIGAESISKYDISPQSVTAEPRTVMTRRMPDLYAGIMIPAQTVFTLTVQYGGSSALLRGNRPETGHCNGDWILLRTCTENGLPRPDFSADGRIINGQCFASLYRPVPMRRTK